MATIEELEKAIDTLQEKLYETGGEIRPSPTTVIQAEKEKIKNHQDHCLEMIQHHIKELEKRTGCPAPFSINIQAIDIDKLYKHKDHLGLCYYSAIDSVASASQNKEYLPSWASILNKDRSGYKWTEEETKYLKTKYIDFCRERAYSLRRSPNVISCQIKRFFDFNELNF